MQAWIISFYLDSNPLVTIMNHSMTAVALRFVNRHTSCECSGPSCSWRLSTSLRTRLHGVLADNLSHPCLLRRGLRTWLNETEVKEAVARVASYSQTAQARKDAGEGDRAPCPVQPSLHGVHSMLPARGAAWCAAVTGCAVAPFSRLLTAPRRVLAPACMKAVGKTATGLCAVLQRWG